MSMFLINAWKNRTADYSIQLFEADGTTELVLAAADSVRIKIGRTGATPNLDLKSGAATSNGSVPSFTVGTNDVTLRIGQADLSSIVPGAYDMEVLVVDDSETAPDNAIKHVQFGVLMVHDSQTGAVTL